jgi:TIR domain
MLASSIAVIYSTVDRLNILGGTAIVFILVYYALQDESDGEDQVSNDESRGLSISLSSPSSNPTILATGIADDDLPSHQDCVDSSVDSTEYIHLPVKSNVKKRHGVQDENTQSNTVDDMERLPESRDAPANHPFVESYSCHPSGPREPCAASYQYDDPFGPRASLSKGRVFVNRTGQDGIAAMLAENVSQKLKERGYRLFYDEETLQPGDLQKISIESHVRASDVFLCIVSKEWYFRYWCMHELNLAFESNCRIIPIFTECGKVDYNNSMIFKGEFYKRHVIYNNAEVNGAVIDKFWNNLEKLQHIQQGPVFRTSPKGNLRTYLDAVMRCIDKEMERQRRGGAAS